VEKSLIKKVAGLTIGLMTGLSALSPVGLADTVQVKAHHMSPHKQPPHQLWIKFSKPKTLVTVDIQAGQSGQLAAITLQGAYNQQQHNARLFLIQSQDDEFWLKQGVPKNIKIENLSVPKSDPNGALKALLERFGKYIKGAIITDPTNPDTVNVATTMAGIDDAMVITPDQQSVVQSYGIHILHDFRDDHLTGAVATYQWAVQNLLSNTTAKDLVMLNPGIQGGSLRDYAVATKSFVFYLTSTQSDQRALMDEIVQHTPANTPILGYIPNEGPDVAELSKEGHFLNASDFLTNESVWSSMPSPKRFKQPKPQTAKAMPDTVYVALLVSDGDNAQYVEHRMRHLWQDPKLGAIPEGWTMAPGMIDFAPTLMSYYYRHLPKNSELLAGPSGVGYATAETGANLEQLGQLSGYFMRRDDMHTVDYWGSPDALGTFAKASRVPSISYGGPLVYDTSGRSVLFGQTSPYISSSSDLLCTIKQQAASEQNGKPLFLEPLIDAWNLTPSDVFQVAQQLVASGKESGQKYVFLTPSELASTMRAYYSNPANGNGSTQGSVPTQNQGVNLVSNPSGENGTNGWVMAYSGQNATLTSTTYSGLPALAWQIQGNLGHSDWLSYYPLVQNGKTYTFSAQVAGSGQVYMDVWTGTGDIQTLPVKLGSGFQTLTWTVTIPANAPGGQSGPAPQLQIRESGFDATTVYIRDASVTASNPIC